MYSKFISFILSFVLLFNLTFPVFAQVEKAIYKLYQNYPHWSSTKDLNELAKAFTNLIQHEYEKSRWNNH